MPHQVKPIHDLHRLRRPTPNPFGIQPTPIAADDLDAGMRLQPRRDRGGRALGEQIHHLMAFEITDHGAEASASPPRPCIKANHPWRRQGGERHAMDATQDRPATPWEAQRVCEPRASTAANRYVHSASGGTNAYTMTATDGDEPRKPLSENAPRTGHLPAEEATNL
jgi:hypothetical protein